jgi:hypothetical protein
MKAVRKSCAWLPIAALLISVFSRLAAGYSDPAASATDCASRRAESNAAAEPLDFTFASAADWKQYALSAEVDARR